MDLGHPVADHELCTPVELREESRDLAEVVGQVGVSHHDPVAAGGVETSEVGAAVAAARLADDAGARQSGEVRAAVGGAVVDDDHLARDVVLLEHRARRAHAALDRLCLVQAGDHHRDVDRSVGGGAAGDG
jgi:hypothetical protein